MCMSLCISLINFRLRLMKPFYIFSIFFFNSEYSLKPAIEIVKTATRVLRCPVISDRCWTSEGYGSGFSTHAHNRPHLSFDNRRVRTERRDVERYKSSSNA